MLNYTSLRTLLGFCCAGLVLAACGGAATPRATAVPIPVTYPPPPTVEPLDPVTANTDWTIRPAPIHAVEMVLVPPGCFTLGTEAGKDNEKPTTHICFNKPFWIDRYEVTDEQFRQFHGVADYTGEFWPGENMPRVQISWFEARAFCQLRDARLPTEAEWEYAARGPDDWMYSWGNQWNPANVSSVGGSMPRPVGSVAGVASWVGAKDMTGNVWEWTSTAYKDYPYDPNDGRENPDDTSAARVMRGGAYGAKLEMSGRTVMRSAQTGVKVLNDVGFRCVRDVQ